MEIEINAEAVKEAAGTSNLGNKRTEKGGDPGRELDDWLQAERELIGPGAHQRLGDGRRL